MFPKIGVKTPKMDGEYNGKPGEQMDDLGGFPIFLVQHPYGFSIRWIGSRNRRTGRFHCWCFCLHPYGCRASQGARRLGGASLMMFRLSWLAKNMGCCFGTFCKSYNKVMI